MQIAAGVGLPTTSMAAKGPRGPIGELSKDQIFDQSQTFSAVLTRHYEEAVQLAVVEEVVVGTEGRPLGHSPLQQGTWVDGGSLSVTASKPAG